MSGPSTSTYVAPAASAAARWACRLPGPNAKSMMPGGRSASAFVPLPCWSVTRTTTAVGAPVPAGAGDGHRIGQRREDGRDRIRRHERQVDRQHEDRIRAARDDVVASFGQTGVEAA